MSTNLSGISHEEHLKRLGITTKSIKGLADKAFESFMRLVRGGKAPQDAIKAVTDSFNWDMAEVLAEEISRRLAKKISTKQMMDYPVGEVSLSSELYRNGKEVEQRVMELINGQAEHYNNARELARTLYDGYDLTSDRDIEIKASLPKYLLNEFDKYSAKRLKTPALRAAYLEAIQEMEDEESLDQIANSLDHAIRQKKRFYADRIAQTEIHQAHVRKSAQDLMSRDDVEFVQIKMSRSHPRTDICDIYAGQDAYGLGAGVYPKEVAPMPSYHPFCRCLAYTRLDLTGEQAQPFNKDAERNFLAKLPDDEARRAAGSENKLNRVFGGDSITDIVNERTPDAYKIKPMADKVSD